MRRGMVAASGAVVFSVASVLVFAWSARNLWTGSLDRDLSAILSLALALVSLACAVVAIADGRPRWLVWSVFPLSLFVTAWALMLGLA
ncbi:MAG: hypothetical protein GQE15_09815 [Archangiaceae bacterium]|nr:hypothetical protein [Archangiaceae bacterium]